MKVSRLREIEEDLLARLLPPVHDSGRRWVIWLVAGIVTALAAVLRLKDLGRPSRLVFDETYYVKQAYSLLTLGYEGRWAEDPNINFAAGNFSDLTTTADYVVHPSVGKWMIAAGMALFDPANSFSWRIGAAVTGIASVLLLVFIARRIFGHIAFGAIAGLLLAFDGIHIVMSRTGILDVFLSFWVLAGFAALLLDRESFRRQLARSAAVELSTYGRYRDAWGVRTGPRWWLLAAGVSLGLATGVKWSGIYFLAVFGLLAVAWSATARRTAGIRLWFGAAVLRDGIPAFLTLVPIALATYLATWLPWFLTPGAYMRDAEPNRLLSLWEYHKKMWSFHTSLSTEHTYMSNPFGWIVQARPTSFAWQQVRGEAAEHLCGEAHCASSILAVGNPAVWWLGALALLLVLWGARRDWRAWAVLAGFLGGWVPWFLYLDRTIFTFYTVAFVPFVALACVYALAVITQRSTRVGVSLAAALTTLALAFGVYFWPIWSAAWVPYWFWRAHMFFSSWI